MGWDGKVARMKNENLEGKNRRRDNKQTDFTEFGREDWKSIELSQYQAQHRASVSSWRSTTAAECQLKMALLTS
jgi:hypothetical protein